MLPISAAEPMKRPRRTNPGYWVKRSKNLGRRALVFDGKDVLILLKATIEREASQAAFADYVGVDRSYISMVLSGRAPLPKPITEALGLSEVYVNKTGRRRGRLARALISNP